MKKQGPDVVLGVSVEKGTEDKENIEAKREEFVGKSKDLVSEVFFDNDFIDRAEGAYNANQEDKVMASIEFIENGVKSEIERKTEELMGIDDEDKRQEEVRRIVSNTMQGIARKLHKKRGSFENSKRKSEKFKISKTFSDLANERIGEWVKSNEVDQSAEGKDEKDEIDAATKTSTQAAKVDDGKKVDIAAEKVVTMTSEDIEKIGKGGRYEMSDWEKQGVKQIEKEAAKRDIQRYFEGVNNLLGNLDAEVRYFKDSGKEKDQYSEKAQKIFDEFEERFEELRGDFEYVKVHQDELRDLYSSVSDAVVRFRKLRGGESHDDFQKYLSGSKREKQEFISGEERAEIELIEKAASITLEKLSEEDRRKIEFRDKEGRVTEEFKKKTREFWTEFAVHGMFDRGKLTDSTDLDGESALKLLKLAGLDISNVEYVPKGKTENRVVFKHEKEKDLDS
ncbi:hypothetical protein ACFL16_01055 [Patescibacteria group bacterium]